MIEVLNKGLIGKEFTLEKVASLVEKNLNLQFITSYRSNASTPWNLIRFHDLDLNIKYDDNGKIEKILPRVYRSENNG